MSGYVPDHPLKNMAWRNVTPILLEAKMTHAEKAIVYEQMREYKAEGHTNVEVAKRFKCSQATAQRICRGICDLSHAYNQYTDGRFDRIANCQRIIERANPNFEYVGGFTDSEGVVNVRCKICGHVFNKSMITLRHPEKNTKCPSCDKAQRQKAKEQAKVERLELAEKRRRSKRIDRMFAKSHVQTALKFCPICNTAFYGSGVYCSERCQKQNKWAMKDGYRYAFPLDEVYQRDGGICYLCGKPCDWNDKKTINGVVVYGNNYPSRDHVIPKSKGGENSWENIRLAHRACNSRKADIPLY